MFWIISQHTSIQVVRYNDSFFGKSQKPHVALLVVSLLMSRYRAPASDVSSVILCGKLTLKCIGVATRFSTATRLHAGAPYS